ncbi:Lipopolysaccharide biosynthesis protein [Algoriphagus ornithinivorans]|uniref:Lipopolysaccharide biosynthesis protein n=1 Tax=Algoriphagus ornithinivorans TaxID=226506 RepID=A0A1I5HIB6_9BACT|nr:glycoside hydrolase family 99-like domain-containing protein [Algoriphagus ornithinivorans]SFO47977.1 Lipopolysaccharide biosynthesis protein [Algoriphagus ornithinivorans]
MQSNIKPVAYYLPQYHPIPENDYWWGKGFTEWTNVTKAKPLFKGHYQPRYPADLGYYDLRVPEVREEQATMAKENGVYGFCYYHYWFGDGKQLLEKPFNEVVESGKPDFPFMLCWANQTWKGVWFGDFQNQVLAKQEYPGIDDYTNHFSSLLPAFKDNRYIKIDGKPVFQVYQPLDLPDSKVFARVFNDLAKDNGFPGIYLLACNVPIYWEPEPNGFHGVISYLFHSFRFREKNTVFKEGSFLGKVEWKWNNFLEGKAIERRKKPKVYKYEKVVTKISKWPKMNFDYYPMVVPDWDNSPRAGNSSMILHGSTPDKWKIHFHNAVNYINNTSPADKFIFIKSWNEWAEGNYLEPDQRWGTAYLKAMKSCL